MNEERINRLKGAGIDVSDALERFMGNEGIMEKFLKKFLTDQNYQKLCDALDGEDFEAALAASHTLKGVSGNLSMTALNGLLTEQVKAFRSGDNDKAKAMMPEIDKSYRAVVDAINE